MKCTRQSLQLYFSIRINLLEYHDIRSFLSSTSACLELRTEILFDHQESPSRGAKDKRDSRKRVEGERSPLFFAAQYLDVYAIATHFEAPSWVMGHPYLRHCSAVTHRIPLIEVGYDSLEVVLKLPSPALRPA